MELRSRYLRSLHARGLSPRTVEDYAVCLGTLSKFVGKSFLWDPDELLEAADVWRFLDEAPYSAAYRRQVLAAARSWHKWGNSRELWPLNGIMSIPSPTVQINRKPPLTDEQVEWLLYHGDEPRQRRLLMLGLYAATRIAETTRIDHSCWLRDRLRFEAKGKGGGGKVREIPLAAPLARHKSIILGASGTKRQIRWAYEKLRRDSPFPWTPHSLRRTFAQRLLDAGVGVEIVEELMGHVPRSTTLVYYGSFSWPRLVDAMGILDNYEVALAA